MALGPAVPGETPIDDISGLKISGICTRAQLSEFEARNIAQALFKYNRPRLSRRSAKFDVPWCLRLHHEMFGDVWAWAGTVRTRDLNLGVRFPMIVEQLQGLLDDLEYWRTNLPDFVEQGARLHHRAVKIHPFLNGNGRWSRLLSNIWLWLNRQPHTQWPEAAIGATSVLRTAYIAAILKADEGDYGHLIDLHRRYSA